MELTRIEVENFKSIKSPINISFFNNLPTILIGKNGSGKTNILEVLSSIAMSNSNYYRLSGSFKPNYRVFIELSEEDTISLLPNIIYDKEKCEIIGYSVGDNLKIDRISSPYIIPYIKKEIEDIRVLASNLKDAVKKYEKQFIKISHKGYDELPINCYQLKNATGGLTSFHCIRSGIEYFLKNINDVVNEILKSFEDDEQALTFVDESHFSMRIYGEPLVFKLEFVEPNLAKFEEKYITIDKEAIKKEITKINIATKESCDKINELIEEIKDRTIRIQEGLDTNYFNKEKDEEKYYYFLRKVQHIIGKRCIFLKNENNDVIFQKQDRNYYNENINTNSIIETYLRQVYKGPNKEELLNSSKKEFQFSNETLKELELYLNNNIPNFDKKMYDGISVESTNKGQISIYLNEKTGEKINLNNTSAGRRWYFTYYFMKNILTPGDIFIIDEPAAMLHPSAQKEVLNDLIELTKKGIKVVYSTHSPYLLPKDCKSVQFVTMTEEGTKVNNFISNKDMQEQMRDIIGEDIFDIQIIMDMYTQGDQKKIAANCYKAIRSKFAKLEEAAKELPITVDAIKSWNSKTKRFRSPKFENVVLVSKYTNIDIKELLS